MEKLNLYLLTQAENTGRSTYNGALVCAESSADARKIHPLEIIRIENLNYLKDNNIDFWQEKDCLATSPENVTVRFLGKADPGVEKGIILSSYVGD